MDAKLKAGAAVLDLGCGSGILAIAAKKLGAVMVVAVDIDPVAQKVTLENAERNGISGLPVLIGNVLSDKSLRNEITGQYDIIVSNIVADIVIALAPFVAQNLKKDGIWISSGVIRDREQDVKQEFLEQGFELLEMKADGEWLAFLCGRTGE
jgi:ribosomal protein L11 methyltransferase